MFFDEASDMVYADDVDQPRSWFHFPKGINGAYMLIVFLIIFLVDLLTNFKAISIISSLRYRKLKKDHDNKVAKETAEKPGEHKKTNPRSHKHFTDCINEDFSAKDI
jgi:hypothetical protein